MATLFAKLNEGWNADPNAPEETIVADGQRIALEFFPNAMIYPEFAGIDRVRLVFDGVTRYRLGATNDEGWIRGQCRFSNLAPAWGEFYEVTGELFDEKVSDWTILRPASSETRRFFYYLRDSTFECDALQWRFEKRF